MRETLYMSIAFTAITIYLGLAVYVLRKSPNRTIGWVFGGICLVVISYFFTNLFLYPLPGRISTSIPVMLRIKWAINVFAATFYLHLSSFYFPPRWQNVRSWYMIPAYAITLLFSLVAVFTNLLLAGPLHRLPGQFTGPEPGVLIGIFFVFFGAQLVAGTVGLIAGYRTHPSPAIRRQLSYLFWPMGLVLASAVVKIVIVLTRDIGRIPPELGELFLIFAGFLFANAALQYGTFVGKPLPKGDLFTTLPIVVVILVALFLGLKLDAYLDRYTPFPFPIVTGMLLVIFVVGIPEAHRWRKVNSPQERRIQAAGVSPSAFADHHQVPLEIYALGTLKIRVHGKEIPESAWESGRAKALLAYLLWKGRDGASRDEITLALWPNHLDEKVANVFHVTMNRLRRVLDPDQTRPRDSSYIIFDGSKYFFNFKSSHWLDVSNFEELIKVDGLSSLKEAVSIYRGSFLDDIAWALPAEVEIMRRGLEIGYEKALRRLIPLVQQDEAEIYLKKLLLVAPADNWAHENMIEIYLKQGRMDLLKEQLLTWQRSYNKMDLDPPIEVQAYWNRMANRLRSGERIFEH